MQFLQDWYIGDAPGSASFYAYCDDDAVCPEDLGPYWYYYAFNSGETLADPDVTGWSYDFYAFFYLEVSQPLR